MTTLVIIPTYNEIDALPPTLERLRSAVPEAHVLVVDDGSPDGTGQWADRLAERDEQVHVLHRTQKGGLGPAYLAGFAWGLEHGHDVLCEMDADSSHRPEQLGTLLTALERGADLAIGSRWVPEGSVHNWPLNRELLSRGANTYVNLALGLGVKDATAGFRAFRAHVLTCVLAGEHIASQGYCFQVDMTRRVRAAGFVIREVPIDFDEREYGESKMSSAIIKEAMLRVTQWGIHHRLSQARSLVKKGA